MDEIPQPPPNNTPQNADKLAPLKRNILLLVALALVLLFFFILFLSATSSGKNNSQNSTTPIQVRPTISVNITPTGTPVPTRKPLNLTQPDMTWSPNSFSEDDLKGVNFNKTVLSDGSIKYTYPSSNANRPNELIVKDDIIIYQRVIVSKKYIYNYTGTLSAPEYSFHGSQFYGQDSMTYLYLQRGTAFVADANTTEVHEQLLFQPMSLDAFKQKYGTDITDYKIIPTLAEE
jgi:hypothetical protein